MHWLSLWVLAALFCVAVPCVLWCVRYAPMDVLLMALLAGTCSLALQFRVLFDTGYYMHLVHIMALLGLQCCVA